MTSPVPEPMLFFEILALRKPTLLIPLSVGTRGDRSSMPGHLKPRDSRVLVESEEEGVLG